MKRKLKNDKKQISLPNFLFHMAIDTGFQST